MTSSAISRRRLFGLLTVGSASLIIAACGSQSAPAATEPPSAEPTKVAEANSASAPAPTKAAETESAAPAQAAAGAKAVGAISFLCRPDIVTAYGADAAVKGFIDAHPGAKITMDKPPQGVDLLTKVRAAIASDSLVWDGFSVMVVPNDTATWADAQVIQPLDDLMNASTEPDVKPLLDGIISTIKEAIKYKGKIYAIPGNVGSVALQWYWEPLKEVGFSKQPETWDETHAAAASIKEKFGDKWIPFAKISTPLCDFYTLLFAATPPKDLFSTEGLLNIQGKGSLDALNWLKMMVKEGLMPPTAQNVSEEWDRKTVAMLMSYDVKGQGAQKTYGYDAADTGVNIFPKAGEVNSGTPFWMNTSVVFNKAKNPQGMMDFLIWWFGPSNGPAQETLVATAAKPCYSYTYDKFVKGSDKFGWEQVGIDMVAKSVPFPANRIYNLQSAAIAPWIDKFLMPDSTLSAEDVVKNMSQDIKDKIAAQEG